MKMHIYFITSMQRFRELPWASVISWNASDFSNFIPEKNIKMFGVTETLFQNTTPTSLVDAWGIHLKETTMATKEVQQEYTSKRTLNKSIEI